MLHGEAYSINSSRMVGDFCKVLKIQPVISQSQPVPGKFSGRVSQDPCDSKSNWLHVDMLRFAFTQLRYILP